MPFTTLTKPDSGDATRKSLADGIIDNLAFLYGVYASLHGASVPNNSFELDTDSDGIPDEWTRTLFTNGAFALDTTAGNFIHGSKSAKFTHPGGVGNGGGTLITADYFEWNEKRPIVLQWSHKCSAAGMLDKVEMQWFDSALSIISTSTIYSSTSNPTSWAQQAGAASPPVNTRYAKLKITGGDSSVNVAGSSYWDDFRILDGSFKREIILAVPGSFTWTPPSDAQFCYAEIFGGGGGGGTSSAGNGGGGGGAGGYSSRYFTPSGTYAITIGSKGATDAAGTATTFAGMTANGGSAGVSGAGGGAGGAGGTASGGDVNTNGSAGSARSGGDGGAGGSNASVGIKNNNQTSGAGANGHYYGAGGTGGANGTLAGGEGSAGAIIIRW
jgi:hypothetical protein